MMTRCSQNAYILMQTPETQVDGYNQVCDKQITHIIGQAGYETTCFQCLKHFHSSVLGSIALYKVEKLLLNERVLRDVEKLSHDHQTSPLQAFHRIIHQFAPRNVDLPFIEVLCR